MLYLPGGNHTDTIYGVSVQFHHEIHDYLELYGNTSIRQNLIGTFTAQYHLIPMDFMTRANKYIGVDARTVVIS